MPVAGILRLELLRGGLAPLLLFYHLDRRLRLLWLRSARARSLCGVPFSVSPSVSPSFSSDYSTMTIAYAWVVSVTSSSSSSSTHVLLHESCCCTVTSSSSSSTPSSSSSSNSSSLFTSQSLVTCPLCGGSVPLGTRNLEAKFQLGWCAFLES